MRNSVSRIAKTNKSKSRQKSVSEQVISFVNQKYNNKIPLSLLTALTKTYNKKVIDANHPFVKRYIIPQTAQQKSKQPLLDGEKLMQYLGSKSHHQKGKPLNEDAIKRVYQNCCNPEGKLSFEYLMKAAESVGVSFPQKLAKAAVRKFGKSKGYMDVNDCIKVVEKRQERKNVKSAPNKRRF